MNFEKHYFLTEKKKKKKKEAKVNLYPAKTFNMKSFFNPKNYDKGVHGTLDFMPGLVGEQKQFPADMRIHNTGRGKFKGEFDPTSKSYKQKEYHFKPNGLWYAFGDSWHDWCSMEQPEWCAGDNYEIIFPLMKNLLRISTPHQLLKFTEEYKGSLPGYSDQFPNDTSYINWQKVANNYDGIEINPYLFSMRMDDRASWYYAWDVASGCVWNTRGLTARKITPQK